MNYTLTTGGNAKRYLLEDEINFSTDTFRCLLMREGFTFSTVKHKARANVKATSGSKAIVAAAETNTLTRSDGGSFVTDGFVVGNYITTTSGTNPGPFQVVTVEALVLTVATINGEAALADGSVTITINAADEYPAGNGYTQDTATVTFTAEEGYLYLDDFTVNDFGQANLDASPGIIVYDYTSSIKPVVLYAKISRLRVAI